MAKGKSTWKYNKLLTARRNYFDTGGQQQQQTSGNFFQQGFGTIGDMFKNPISTLSSASPMGLGAASMISSGIGALGGVAGKLLSNGLSSGAGNIVSGVGDALGSVPILGGFAKGALNIVGGGINALFGMKTNQAEVNRVNADTANMADAANAASAAQSFDDNALAGPSAVNFNVNAYKGGLFKKGAARRKNAALAAELRAANNFAGRTAINSIENLQDEQLDNALGNFAAFGGELNTQGGDFTNGLLYIDNGGSHEANPYEGVQLGVDPEGNPNLVEEGETVFNDYVFSKRLKVPDTIRNKYKVRGTKDLTFAEMSKKLAKESEERPNDPISIRGLEAIMADLANAQEGLRETQQVRQHALGGTLFSKGGKKRGNQVLDYNNRTNGLYFGLTPEQFNPYASDGTINWDIMYGADSPYTKRRQYVIDHWDDPSVVDWRKRYVEGINDYNKGRKGYQPMTVDDITLDIFKNRTSDKSWGGMHAGIDYAGNPEKKIIEKHMLRNLKSGPTAMPDTDIYYPNTRGGYTWADRFSDKYTRANNGAYEETTDNDGNTVRTYYYDPVEAKKPANRYYKKNSNGQYELVTGDNPYLTIQNAGKYNQVRSAANDQNGTDYYYDPEEADPEYKKLPTGLRYAPAVGLGIAAITDAFGLTNKPDYSNADAILEVSKGSGTYQPVKFNPVGNYLTYRPFDRNYYINKMNAEAGATRRAISNTSGGNRATAMAGILAADNNYLNQIGGLARQAEEYNLAQRAQVEDFNRGTNTTNSQGFLQADIANQKALMDSREFSLKGTMAAAEMRERARLASEQAKSANLSGFITALGDIGRENMGWNWRNFGLATGSFGNVGDEQYLLTNTSKKKSNKGAKGGKMKRRKGLTI